MEEARSGFAMGHFIGADTSGLIPAQPDRLEQRMQGAIADHGAAERHAGGAQTPATAVHQVFHLGVGQRLLHEPVGDDIDQRGIKAGIAQGFGHDGHRANMGRLG